MGEVVYQIACAQRLHRPAHGGFGAFLVPVPAILDHPSAADEHIGNVRCHPGENECVKDTLTFPAGQQRVIKLNRHHVRPVTGGKHSRAQAERGGPALGGAAVECLTDRWACLIREDGSAAQRQPLGVFQKPQLFPRTDADIAVAADAEFAVGADKHGGGKNAIAQVGLGRGAQAHGGAGADHLGKLLRRAMRGMDQAPARVNGHVVQQPANRALA